MTKKHSNMSISKGVTAENRTLTLYAGLGIVTAALGGLIYGIEIGFGPIAFQMESFRDIVGWETTQSGCGKHAPSDPVEVSAAIGWLNGVFTIMTAVGGIVGGFMSDRFGRKSVIYAGCIFYLIGALMEALAGVRGSDDVVYHMVEGGRILTGIGNGFTCMVSPLYASEISPSHWRGSIVSVFQFTITLGIFIGGLANLKLSQIELGWRVAFAAQAIVAIIYLVFALFLPRSPRFLVKVGKTDEALAVLRKLNNAPTEDGASYMSEMANQELHDIEQEVADAEKAKQTSWLDLFKGTNLTALIFGVGIGAFQKTSGINFIMNYMPTIAKQACVDPFLANCIMNALNMLFTIPAIVLVDRVGRKYLMIWATLAIIPAYVGAAAIFYSVDDFETQQGLGWFMIILIYFFVGCFAIAWGPMGWLIPSEIFPIHMRGKGMGLATGANMLFDYALNSQLSIVLLQPNVWGVGGTVVFFLCLAVVTSLPLVLFWQAETKSVTMEEMRSVLNFKAGGGGQSNAGTWKEYVARNWRQSVQVMTCRKVDPKDGAVWIKTGSPEVEKEVERL